MKTCSASGVGKNRSDDHNARCKKDSVCKAESIPCTGTTRSWNWPLISKPQFLPWSRDPRVWWTRTSAGPALQPTAQTSGSLRGDEQSVRRREREMSLPNLVRHACRSQTIRWQIQMHILRSVGFLSVTPREINVPIHMRLYPLVQVVPQPQHTAIKQSTQRRSPGLRHWQKRLPLTT